MNDDPLEPAPDWMNRLLDEERVRVDDDPAMRDAVLRHVETVIGAPPPDGGGNDGGGSSAAGGGGAGAAAGAGATASSIAGKVFSVKAVAGIAALAFATGTATGVGLSGRPDVPRPLAAASTSASPPLFDRSPPPPSSVAALDVASLPAAATASAPTPAPPTARPASDVPSPDLSRERELVDLARAALAKQNPSLALETVARHEATFPNGKLREERDALRVQALARAGRRAEAEAAAARFHRVYPSSLLGAVVDAALAPR